MSNTQGDETMAYATAEKEQEGTLQNVALLFSMHMKQDNLLRVWMLVTKFTHMQKAEENSSFKKIGGRGILAAAVLTSDAWQWRQPR